MRVTSAMMVNDMLRNLNTNTRRLDESQRQLYTGRKINAPSDDPSGLVKALRLRTALNENQQYLANINEANSFMDTTDGALNSINEVLQRVRELTVKASTGSNAPDDMKAIATEIEQLREQLLLVANSTYGSKYIFAGSNVTQAPCDGDFWKGNSETLPTEIGIGVKIALNLDMKAFFGNPGGVDTGGSPDGGLFALMNDLKTAVDNSEHGTASSMLDNIDAKLNELSGKRAVVGARVNRMELQQNRLQEAEVSLSRLLGGVEDADMEQVIMNLRMQENVYRASLAAGARIIQPSLADFLR